MSAKRKNKIAYFYDSERLPRRLERPLRTAAVATTLRRRRVLLAPRLAPLLAAAVAPTSLGPTPTPPADDYTGYYYGPDHPMKPQRIAMTHQLVLGYGLHKHLDVYVRALPCPALRPQLGRYPRLRRAPGQRCGGRWCMALLP